MFKTIDSVTLLEVNGGAPKVASAGASASSSTELALVQQLSSSMTALASKKQANPMTTMLPMIMAMKDGDPMEAMAAMQSSASSAAPAAPSPTGSGAPAPTTGLA